MATPLKRATKRPVVKSSNNKSIVMDKLLKAMERLLEQGHQFASVSVEQLMAEAGMSRGTFYLHFRDKGELVLRLMDRLTDDVVQSSGTWLANTENPQREDIEKALRGAAKSFKKHHAILAALTETALHDATVAALYEDMMKTICDRCRHSVAAVQGHGLNRSGADDAVADALSWFVVLYLGRFSPRLKRADLDRLITAMAHICVNAVFEVSVN